MISRGNCCKYLSCLILTTIILTYIRLFNEATETSAVRNKFAQDDLERTLLTPEQIQENVSYSDYEKHERMVALELNMQDDNEGSNGAAVFLTKPSHLIDAQFDIEKFGINVLASRFIKYTRSLGDHRNPTCLEIIYDVNNLPKADVVIVFHNVPFSILLRTVHQILDKSPDQLLHRIILVDDASTSPFLLSTLDHYLNTRLKTHKVKLLRLKKRIGLVGGRLVGARYATANVLVFMDPMSEPNEGWLEPLLSRIQSVRTAAVTPVVDTINGLNFQYIPSPINHEFVEVFRFDGGVELTKETHRNVKMRFQECIYKNKEICPQKLPIFTSPMMAIERNYFWEMGSYDEQMNCALWHNYEIAFRLWQCGGSLQLIPCSRVGIVRPNLTVSTNQQDIAKEHELNFKVNMVRTAMVWMDDYLELVYLYYPEMRQNPDVGDTTHRRLLRNKLQCNTFKWYLANVTPYKYLLNKNVAYLGQLKGFAGSNCISILDKSNWPHTFSDLPKLTLAPCSSNLTHSQFFVLTHAGQLRNEYLCVGLYHDDHLNIFTAYLYTCNEENVQLWVFTFQNQIKHVTHGKCLLNQNILGKKQILAGECDDTDNRQKWSVVLRTDRRFYLDALEHRDDNISIDYLWGTGGKQT